MAICRPRRHAGDIPNARDAKSSEISVMWRAGMPVLRDDSAPNGDGFIQNRSGTLTGVDTVEYSPGRLADLFGGDGDATVLVWHGMQSDARAALRPLAELVSNHGLNVVVPDWDSHAADGGRADLLASAQFARQQADDALVLVGWSLGGVAAAGLTIHAPQFGLQLAHTFCLAGAFMANDPISGTQLTAALSGAEVRTPFTLLHGVADHVVPIRASLDFASALERNDWRVEVVELDADHAAIAGAAYDPFADRYSAAEDADMLTIADEVAARIASASRL
jgi:predicted alpha/beta hydrolase family esterase